MNRAELQTLKPGALLITDFSKSGHGQRYLKYGLDFRGAEHTENGFIPAPIDKYVTIKDRTNIMFIKVAKNTFPESAAIVLYQNKFFFAAPVFLSQNLL